MISNALFFLSRREISTIFSLSQRRLIFEAELLTSLPPPGGTPFLRSEGGEKVFGLCIYTKVGLYSQWGSIPPFLFRSPSHTRRP
jgi:hypothetical protein